MCSSVEEIVKNGICCKPFNVSGSASGETKVMSEVKSDKSEAGAKKLNDDFHFQQFKDAKSECEAACCCSINLLMALSVSY